MDRRRHPAWLLGLLSALLLPACTTTASRELVVAVQNYDARSREAIATMESIERKAVEQPPVREAEAEAQFTADILNPRATIAEDYVQQRLHPFDTAQSVTPLTLTQFAELRCVHGRFTAAFSDVERAGFFGKRSVADGAPPILDQLIAQQVYLASLVQMPLWVRFQGYRSALVAQIAAVRDGPGSDAEKTQALIALRGQWLALEAEEAQLRTQAVADLVKAAATGVALRRQLADYGKLSLADLTDSAKGLTAFITAVSGRDLSALGGRVDEVKQQIEADPDFSSTARALLAAVDVPRLPGMGGGPPGAGPGAGEVVAAMPAAPTPCLSRAGGATASGEVDNGGQ